MHTTQTFAGSCGCHLTLIPGEVNLNSDLIWPSLRSHTRHVESSLTLAIRVGSEGWQARSLIQSECPRRFCMCWVDVCAMQRERNYKLAACQRFTVIAWSQLEMVSNNYRPLEALCMGWYLGRNTLNVWVVHLYAAISNSTGTHSSKWRVQLLNAISIVTSSYIASHVLTLTLPSPQPHNLTHISQIGHLLSKRYQVTKRCLRYKACPHRISQRHFQMTVHPVVLY